MTNNFQVLSTKYLLVHHSISSHIANDLISDTIYCTDHIAAGEEVDGGEFEGLFDSLSRSLGDNIFILKCIEFTFSNHMI